MFDGYRIVRELHGSSRSHIYLAVDIETDALVAIKIPSIDLRDDPAYLKRFMMEEWVARRIDSPHVLKPRCQSRTRNFLYVVTEFIDGQTLTQWMIDNPKPGLETVRGIVEQIAKGLRAFHRMEMLHQDLRPDNIMIDTTGTVKIIDFGSTRIAGVAEAAPSGIDDRHPRHGAIHRAGIFPRRGGLAALRPVLARRHHLSDADGPAALWRQIRENQDEIATAKSCGTDRRSTTIAKSRPGSTERSGKRCIRTRTSATRNYPNSFSIFAIPTKHSSRRRRSR